MTGFESPEGMAASWLRDGRRVVAATLVDTDGSAPLDPGATMLIDEGGRIEGSVTGGCVEGALVEEAHEVFGGGASRLKTYGISDTQAADVGLMCGGTVHILVHELEQRHEELLETVAADVAAGRPAALATLVDGENAGAMLAVSPRGVMGSLGLGDLMDDAVSRDADGCIAHGYSTIRSYGSGGEVMGSERRVFIRAFMPPAVMVIFGAIDFSAAVAVIARHLGYEVRICDAREPFARGSRFRVADEVVIDWPDRYLSGQDLTQRDVVLVFTHDPKFDEPALIAALKSGAGYIGALGSRQTHDDRRRRLLAAGVGEAELDRIHAPCGLDIGARTPEETALSVLAEIIGTSTGRRGEPLAETSGRIHSPTHVPPDVS